MMSRILALLACLCLWGCSPAGIQKPSSTFPPPSEPGTFQRMPDLNK